MANHKSALKRIRQTKKRTERNTSRRNRIRTYVRKVEEAITNGDAGAAEAALKAAMPELHRGASKGVMHQKTASRKVSRLTQRVKALSA